MDPDVELGFRDLLTMPLVERTITLTCVSNEVGGGGDGHLGVGTVQARVDGGDWHDARLAAVASTDTWRQWVWTWDAGPGLHRLEVRSTDATGDPQPGTRRPAKPDGATGWHSVTVTVT